MAEQCPDPEKIKERKINRDYEWTIGERRTLEDVLSVEKLYSVRIKNEAEYVACYYSGSRNLLRMDAKPLKQPCIISRISGHWEMTNSGEHVCKEADLALCEYDIKCEETNDPN